MKKTIQSLGFILSISVLLGCSKTEPLASFTTSGSPCTAPCTVTFNNQSENATGYYWTFGNGQTSDQFQPSILYTTPGTYSVVLNASNSDGVSQATGTVTILQAPPTKVRVTRITISNFPLTKPNGSNWDNNPLTGNYRPDIYATLTNASNTVLFSIPSASRMEEAQPNSPFFWNINYLHTNLSMAVYVDLWDYDDTSSDEYMGWTGPWDFMLLSNYPTTHTVNANGITATLNLQWEQ